MITDIVNKLIELRKMQSSNYNQTKKAFICDEAIAKIKELEDRLNGEGSKVFLVAELLINRSKVDELTAKLDKAKEALNSCIGGDDYYNRPIIEKALQELDK